MPVKAPTKEQIQLAERFTAYQQDPIGFMIQCLDVKKGHIWPKMREVAESVVDNQLTIVPACHSVSKTFGAGRIAVWFKTCFVPSTVVTTAPSDNLVRNQLWREIHAAYSGAKIPLGGKMTTLQWELKPSKHILEAIESEQRAQWEKNFAIGFSTSPDTLTEHATKIQGFHNYWVLVIMDEGCGIYPQIWKSVMEGLVINERCKVLAIGNPTDPTGEFYKACQTKSGWNVINISVEDTPNFKEGREIIPGVAGRDYYDRMLKKYGRNSNTFKIRVLGQFGDYREGTFYGRELAEAINDERIGGFPHDPALLTYSFTDLGDIYTAAIFAQFIKGRIRIIDCYWDNQGLGIPNYAKVTQTKPYVFKDHYAGPDLITSNEKSVQTGQTTRDVAAQLGINLTPVIKHSFDNGIEAVRSIWPLLEINEPYCKVFIEAARNYRKRKSETLSTDDQPAYHDTPLKPQWEAHMMDALRHLAMAYRYYIKLGYFTGSALIETPTTTYAEDCKASDYDVLES